MAFSVLAVAVVRDVDRRAAARTEVEQQARENVVDLAQDIFASFLSDIDFGRMPLRRILEQSSWRFAADAYITDFHYRVQEDVYILGTRWLNPLGPYDEESARRRQETADLVHKAHVTEQVQRTGDVVAFPIYSGPKDERRKWGAAYVRVALPSLPELPEGIGLRGVAAAFLGATMLAGAFVFLLVHRLILTPIEAIADGARRVSNSVFDEAVPKTGRHDEIDALVDAFNGMMAEIGQKREALEAQVDEVVAKMRIAEQKLVLTDRLAAMGTLAAGIAHEINNPLGGMLNAIRSIRRRGTSENERTDRYLAMVDDGLERIRAVVERVLRFSPGRRGEGPIDLQGVVEDAARFVRHRLQRSRTQLDVDIEPGLFIKGDTGSLGQVFLNLIANAIDAMDGIGGRVRILARGVGDDVVVSVEDTGCGMPEEVRQQAFNLFYTTKAGQGTGLGLSIVHQIVVDHGGSVEIESEPPRGTTVHIVLPRDRARS